MVKRKCYNKPRLQKVKFMPEEVLLTACKNASTTTTKNSMCPPGNNACQKTEGS